MNEPAPAPPPPTSLAARLLNVIVAPDELFEHLKSARETVTNWVVPSVLLLLVSWVCSTALLSQEWVRHDLLAVQESQMRKALEKQGKSAAEIEEASTKARPVLEIMARFGPYVAPVAQVLLGCFAWGLVLWLIGAKALGGQISVHRALEVAGLLLVLTALGAVLKTLLILATGNLAAAPGAVLLVKSFDPSKLSHAVLQMLDAVSLWGLWLSALGMGRLSGRPTGQAALWVFGVWATICFGLIGLGHLLQKVAS